jgi:hypothetical protein
MKPSASESDLSALNAVVLKEAELFSVIDEFEKLREIGICSKLAGSIVENRAYEENPEKAKAILVRLEVLSMMIENDELKDWLSDENIGVMPAIANKALIAAAAKHSLSIIDGDTTFEKRSFLRRVLELAEPEGSTNS